MIVFFGLGWAVVDGWEGGGCLELKVGGKKF